MIEPRIYRAAFIPALIALVLVAFSLEAPPAPLPQGLAADALFDGQGATALLHEIVQQSPDRRPGARGDAAAAGMVQTTFRQAGFPTTVDHFSADGRNLTNVVAKKPGDTTREIVIVAARDAASVPDAATSAADTAALLEYAHVFQGSAAHDTLVLASVDGATLGDAGARRLAASLSPSSVDAVLVLSNLGANRSRGPVTLNWANSDRRGNIVLERTAADSLRLELGQIPHSEGWIAQFARLAFPIGPGAQGAMIDDGLRTLRISGSGELRPHDESVAGIDQNRYGALGRGILRLVSALDTSAATPKAGPASYLEINGQVLPGWAVSLLAVSLMVPALLASVDALARARRRREPVALWFAWLAAGAVPFALAYIVGKLFVLVGLGPYAPPAPLDPATISIGVADASALVLTVFTAALAWIVLRPLLLRLAGGLPAPTGPGAAAATSLAVSAIGFGTAFVNPYAALLLVPVVHLWLLACLTRWRPQSATIAATAALLPLFLVALYYCLRFELNPLTGSIYLMLLVLGGQLGVAGTVVFCLLLGVGASLAAIIFSRWRSERAEEQRVDAELAGTPRVFGPGGYAGPGALSGPQSTARR